MTAVFTRAGEAILATGTLQTRSIVVTAVSRNLCESELVVQCAWCGRFGDGEDRWAFLPGFFVRPSRVTGSICRGCLAANSPQPRL